MVDAQFLQHLVLAAFSGSVGSLVTLLATLVAVAVATGRGPGGRA